MKKKLRKDKLGVLGLKPNGRPTRYEVELEEMISRWIHEHMKKYKYIPKAEKTKAELKVKPRKERWDWVKRKEYRTTD